jgi:hypothetical protein
VIPRVVVSVRAVSARVVHARITRTVTGLGVASNIRIRAIVGGIASSLGALV